MQQTSWQAMASAVFLQLSSGKRRHPCSFGSDLCLFAKTGPLPAARWSSLAPHASGLCAGVRGVPGCGMEVLVLSCGSDHAKYQDSGSSAGAAVLMPQFCKRLKSFT